MDNKHSRDSNSLAENAFERDGRRRLHHWAVTVIYEEVVIFRGFIQTKGEHGGSLRGRKSRQWSRPRKCDCFRKL